jgi:3-oxoacyl-[acyl-carrier protein] reductase
MNFGIKKKNALVTGGANGVGKSISEGLANEGVNVFFYLQVSKKIREIENSLKKFLIQITMLNNTQFIKFKKTCE